MNKPYISHNRFLIQLSKHDQEYTSMNLFLIINNIKQSVNLHILAVGVQEQSKVVWDLCFNILSVGPHKINVMNFRSRL